jgi:hypothetical protein
MLTTGSGVRVLFGEPNTRWPIEIGEAADALKPLADYMGLKIL